MRDEASFATGMRDCKESVGGGKLVILMAGQGNLFFRAENGM